MKFLTKGYARKYPTAIEAAARMAHNLSMIDGRTNAGDKTHLEQIERRSEARRKAINMAAHDFNLNPRIVESHLSGTHWNKQIKGE